MKMAEFLAIFIRLAKRDQRNVLDEIAKRQQSPAPKQPVTAQDD